MTEVVLDSSALLVLWRREPGAARVRDVLVGPRPLISAVNLSEIIAKLQDWGVDAGDARAAIERFNLRVVPFDEEHAYEAGQLRAPTRARGLSFGDRACIALGRRSGFAVITADRVWAGLDLDVQVQVVRTET